MHEWLEKARLGLEEVSGRDVPRLTQIEIDELLDLARVAAHDSGDRTNAPLVCYLLGLSRATPDAQPLSELVDGVIQSSDE